MNMKTLCVMAIVCAMSLVEAHAQTHFTFTSLTGNNCTIIVPTAADPRIDTTSLSNGDEIGAFTSQGLCVGATVWQGSNTNITVWGDNDQTPEVDGITTGDTIRFRIWRQTDDTEIDSVVWEYSNGTGTYTVNAFQVLSDLQAFGPSAPPPATDGAATLQVTAPMLGLWNGTTHKASAAIVELREGASVSASTLVARAAGIFDNTGTLSVQVPSVDSANYWIVVRHNGHFPIASATQQVCQDGETTTYDFSDAQNKAHVGSQPPTVLSSGKYVVKSGDIDGDKSASAFDFLYYFQPYFGVNNPGGVPE